MEYTSYYVYVYLYVIIVEVNETSNSNEKEYTRDKCEMLGTFGYVIQFVLGVLAFMVLFIKRCYEKPKRPWKVWWFDASKQIFSAGFAHVVNLILSVFLSTNDVNECVLYFVNTFMDCTLGVAISFMFMKIVNCLSRKYDWKVSETQYIYSFI